MHIAVVVDLRDNRKAERDTVTALGMQYVPIPWFCMRPKDIVIAQFLSLLRDNPNKKNLRSLQHRNCPYRDDGCGISHGFREMDD